MSYCGCDPINFQYSIAEAFVSGPVEIYIVVDPACPYRPEADWGDGGALDRPAMQADGAFTFTRTVQPAGLRTFTLRMPHMEYWVRRVACYWTAKSLLASLGPLNRLEFINIVENDGVSNLAIPWPDLSTLKGKPLNTLEIQSANADTGPTGKLSDLAGMPLKSSLYLSPARGITGSLGDLAACPDLESIYFNFADSIDLSGLGSLHTLKYLTLSATAPDAQLNAMMADAYAHRMEYLYGVADYINSGVMPGVYQDTVNPTTAREYLYKLRNDPDGEGFPTWRDFSP